MIRELNTVAPYGYNLAVRRLTDEDAAIIKFNAYQWTDKQYAQLFGIFVQTIQLVKRSSAKFSHYTPYDYITREHLPSGLKILD